MNQLDLENLIYECLDNFPKNTNLYSDQAKKVIVRSGIRGDNDGLAKITTGRERHCTNVERL